MLWFFFFVVFFCLNCKLTRAEAQFLASRSSYLHIWMELFHPALLKMKWPHVRSCRITPFSYSRCCEVKVAVLVLQHVVQCSRSGYQSKKSGFLSLLVFFQSFPVLTSFPSLHVELWFCPVSTHARPFMLTFKFSLCGKSGPTAHPGIILCTGPFPAVRKIFPSIERKKKRGRLQSALRGTTEPICDFSLPARTGNESDSFAIRKFSPSFRIWGLNFPKTHLIHSPLLGGCGEKWASLFWRRRI